ncbi:tRNA (cytidine/uridine-2'-O-)-methyltransferase [Jatrophihabitans sp. GAS493]|uniref:tRNA (cytidine(34)-2'-O)-methyltransferase n=1 Tax=Jatrophihabitans sp. GAS493 TaxID=1907575 RepID=UPI000BB904BA|nr:tRNA (cytidine(34)-2'-O)-methyltransferase [Jatrophihabitans sp. GAS493]SOD71385.1 tRNA (cytidine/uridine-2'-O-)-methyltransferase [Jatrophihabitans sp. GAS493]
MFRIAFVEPKIPPNTGNAIRLVAATGCELHLIGPLGFDLSDAKLRRAGLDYHDLASVTVHENLEAAWPVLAVNPVAPEQPARTFAFTGKADRIYSDVSYRSGDVLMFGAEPTGLADEVLADPRITELVRIPMLPGLRSLNLANCAALVTYEAWRQNGFAGSSDTGPRPTRE